MLVWYRFIESWRRIFGKTLPWSKVLTCWMVFRFSYDNCSLYGFILPLSSLLLCSAQYTLPSQHGETTQKSSLWQVYLWKLTDIMIQQHVGWTFKVWNYPTCNCGLIAFIWMINNIRWSSLIIYSLLFLYFLPVFSHLLFYLCLLTYVVCITVCLWFSCICCWQRT